MRDGFDVLPGSQHVEDDAVNAASLSRPQDLVNVSNAQVPRRMATAEPQVDVSSRDVGEVLATFHRNEMPLRADCIEKCHREGTGARTSLDDGCTWENVTHVGDHAGILRVDDGCAAGH